MNGASMGLKFASGCVRGAAKAVLPSLIVSVGFALSGCIGGAQPTPLADDPRECARNFTYSGSFAAGQTFKTNVTVQKVKQNQAMKRAANLLVSDGYQITNIDNNLGVISASQAVSYGSGKTVPLNVSVTKVGGGVKVNMSYSVSGGVSSPTEAVRNYFCSIAEAVEGK
ncbi:MAG: hypothetical protein LBO72_06930 [Helicobacteraceae bacterium]|jgi:hypothetical protein|nr:hypothetical protein [Helicobacteraceae bacterium]